MRADFSEINTILNVSIIAVQAGALLPIVWKANRALNRWIDVLREYPPHRHINSSILYPSGLEPGSRGRLGPTGPPTAEP